MKIADVAREAGVSRQAVYLHFADRSGVLVALVRFMDESLRLSDLIGRVVEAPSGEDALRLLVEPHSVYAPKIDAVARVLEANQHQDQALAGAWRDRMKSRREFHRSVIERIAAEGSLADSWTIDAAADLLYSVTMPGVWRELTSQLGWSPEQYARRLTDLPVGSFVAR